MKPGDEVIVRCQVVGELPRGQTILVGDCSDDNAGTFYAGIGDVLPLAPNLWAVARWLVDHFDEDKLGAMALSSEALQHWIDGCKDNGTTEDYDTVILLRGAQVIVDALRDVLRVAVPEALESGR